MNSSPLSTPTPAQVRASKLAKRLAHALRNDGLQIHYQPEVHLPTRKTSALEALCRWHDAEIGWVAPDEFVAVAETHGLIIELGRHVLLQVLRDLPSILRRWPDVRVAVNASVLELSQEDFATALAKTLGTHGSHLAEHLELEVTESVFHHKLPVVLKNLTALRQLGLTIAIDDFGTGQSSLSRLHSLPFDKIKLDRSFVQALAEPMVRAIVKLMAELAQTFSHQLVAEGVENSEQLQTLMDLGCPWAQGYAFCRPAPLQDLPDQPGWPDA